MKTKTIDYVNGHDEFDGSLWFFDGKYIGYDDQIGEYDFAPNGTQCMILFRHRVLKPDVDYDDVLSARSLEEVEPYLEPMEVSNGD